VALAATALGVALRAGSYLRRAAVRRGRHRRAS
jgi:hypothetical protein